MLSIEYLVKVSKRRGEHLSEETLTRLCQGKVKHVEQRKAFFRHEVLDQKGRMVLIHDDIQVKKSRG